MVEWHDEGDDDGAGGAIGWWWFWALSLGAFLLAAVVVYLVGRAIG